MKLQVLNAVAFNLVVLTIVAFGVFPKLGVAEETPKNTDVIDEKFLQTSSEEFTISSDGFILSGPIRYKGDPIDYSGLIKDDVLFDLFKDVLLDCNESNEICDNGFFHQSLKEFRLKIFTGGNILELSDFDDISVAIEHSLDVAGFPVIPEGSEEKADIILYIGSLDYLWKKSRANSDGRATKVIERKMEETTKSFPSNLLSSEKEFDDSCFASNGRKAGRVVSQIYVHADSINTCLSRVFLTSIGLYSTDSTLPTMTSRLSKFRSLTFADYLFSKMLFHKDFERINGYDELSSFWDGNVSSIRNEINAELLQR